VIEARDSATRVKRGTSKQEAAQKHKLLILINNNEVSCLIIYANLTFYDVFIILF